jgi:hypothetical protein
VPSSGNPIKAPAAPPMSHIAINKIIWKNRRCRMAGNTKAVTNIENEHASDKEANAWNTGSAVTLIIPTKIIVYIFELMNHSVYLDLWAIN